MIQLRDMKSSSSNWCILGVGEYMVLLVGLPKRPRVIGGNDVFKRTYMITSGDEEDMVKLVELLKRASVVKYKDL